ncbi:LytTR family DNA-binding domain-containing protein [Odoribacter sp. OttesenSCG-928-L07]|nr:LytTR family DNA-binding domain-containing protein [Odoribacter sp. OttesenSCG-928-L07]MDL2239322.1 LytTR family DNA-binding domain-containing protein [Bacteroidales bacterium OttesenSCG-928-L14]MDL2240367.1 LytTR family DNA-binding domain-containing protein [Bacteroidales bacterium OttesenSCG-928-K22]
MKIKCIIIDDEPLALGLIESYVKKTAFLELAGTFSSAVEALEIISKEDIDLIFLDIQMPDLNGLEFSRAVPEKTKIIFITAFEQYALESYKVSALDYLLKPVSYSDFLTSTSKALNWFKVVKDYESGNNKEDIKHIFVKADYKLIQIELDKILYVEGLKDYVKIFIENEPYPIVSHGTMKSMEERLPSYFLRVHKSYIVNKHKIKVIENNRIVFGNIRIPIGDTYKSVIDRLM